MKWLLALLVIGRVVHADPAPEKAPREFSIEAKAPTVGSRLLARLAWSGPDANVMAPPCSGCELAPTLGFKVSSTSTAEAKIAAIATGTAFALAITAISGSAHMMQSFVAYLFAETVIVQLPACEAGELIAAPSE
jgi:hypothetical protein